MIKVKVTNPYFDEIFTMVDITKERYENFLTNLKKGNEEVLIYTNEKGNTSTFNPAYFATTELLKGE